MAWIEGLVRCYWRGNDLTTFLRELIEPLPSPNPGLNEKFPDLRPVAKNINYAGKLALFPCLHTSDRELWQLHMLKSSQCSNVNNCKTNCY